MLEIDDLNTGEPASLWATGIVRDWRIVPVLLRLQGWALLIIAIIVGGYMRFHQLQKFELTADEGASWFAASAPSIRKVVEMQRSIDPGKLAVYDLALHSWIRLFGDGIVAMRAMSSLLGILAILFLFAVVRELCVFDEELQGTTAELAGGFAAIVLATNLAMSISARTARMYPMLLDAELLQMFFFIRLHRKAGIVNHVAAAFFTALSLAINFTATFLFAAEGAWISALAISKWLGLQKAFQLNLVRPTIALIIGLVLLIPIARTVTANSASAVEYGAINWIKLQPLWPLLVFAQEFQRTSLRVIVLLGAAYAIWRHRKCGKALTGFVILWLTVPILIVMLISWTIHPLEVDRYVLITFLAPMALAGLGMASLKNILVRLVLIVLMVHAGLRQNHSYLKGPPRFTAAWKEAADIAVTYTTHGKKIVVFPLFAADVVQYYLAPERRKVAQGWTVGCKSDAVLVLSGFWITPREQIASIRKCYPRMVAQLPEIEIRLP